ncbi:SAP domain-containing protein [Kribbella italica]|uniref:SAP domain-containing protein n=1 Tax=Kribbella italica TaxID=1540520 RepID=A0A7W9J8V1_9ACTN|nr:SAP domain-containing protein [Kribbella italica]MBB5837754.1 hypothetical protein [Kribbella italica]
MSEQINVGESIEFDTTGYVRLPDGAVVTSSRTYTVRQEGLHVFVKGNEEREFEGINPDKPIEDGDDDSEDYNDWKADTLRAELRERELPASGNKAEMVARLEADDEDED